MSDSNESLIAALRAAVQSAPENLELRAHFARVLLDAGKFEDAFIEAGAVLRAEPQHPAAFVNQLLAEMDSIKADNDGLFVLAATNHPWDVDTRSAVPAGSTVLFSSVRPTRTLESPSCPFIFAGAWLRESIRSSCDTATEHAMEDSLKRGKTRPIEQKDFNLALKEVKPSTRAWPETARNYAMFANEGGAYDDLLEYLRAARLI